MEITDSDCTTIRSTIEQQFQAFQADNSEAAFALASPDIQAQFQTAENFMRIVKTDYSPVYRPRSVIFETVTTIQGNITQMVLLLSLEGIPIRALYLMEKQPDQTWKINGCFLVPVTVEII